MKTFYRAPVVFSNRVDTPGRGRRVTGVIRQYQCVKCQRTLFESDGVLRQVIKIRCRRCGAWNVFECSKPERPAAAGEK